MSKPIADVRAFEGRLVRAQAAPKVVSAMAETPAGALVPPPPPPTTTEDYLDVVPGLFVYRQTTERGSFTGIVCEIGTASFADGGVRGHEGVQPARVEALVAHIRTRPARVDLVTTLYDLGPLGRAALDAATETEPELDVEADGVRHTVWRLRETEPVRDELSAGTHYIADGHHRAAAGLALWERLDRPIEHSLLTVVYPYDGLGLAAFDRRVPGPVDAERCLAVIAEEFELRALADRDEPVGLRIYLDGRWYAGHYRGERPAGAAGLDVSLLHDGVLDRLEEFCTATSVEIAPARTTLDHLVAACDADGGVLFALAAPAVEELVVIADAGEVVPAKSTFFEPKPASGIFVRQATAPPPARPEAASEAPR